MDIHDQHIHSFHSFDSKQNPTDYLSLELKQHFFITTEHKEFIRLNGYTEPTFFALRKTMMEHKSNYKWLIGVEIGYNSLYKHEIKHYLLDNEFDLVLISNHDNDIQDYGCLDKLTKQEIDQYFSKIYESIESVNGNVLAHVDYPFRYHNYSMDEMQNPKIIEIFEKMIDKKISLEFNTGSAYKYNNLAFYTWLFKTYYDYGGRKITLSSDAHRVEDYKYMFKEALVLLDELGFDELCYYVKQKESKLLIKDVLTYY